MVWACCCRSVDTRTYNATCIGCSLWLSRRRHRPAQDKLVCLVPPVLPIWLLAGLPPDLEGAPHGRPPAADSVRRATPADPAAAAAAAATTPDAAGRSGSSRTCYLRSNHRAHHPVLRADPRLGDATAAASRPGRAVDLAGAGCYAQLRLAREAAGDQRLPWEVPRPQPRRSPYRVRRGFPRLLCALGSPAATPKPSGCSPGRPKGRPSGPAVRYPAIKKPAKKPRKKRPTTAAAA